MLSFFQNPLDRAFSQLQQALQRLKRNGRYNRGFVQTVEENLNRARNARDRIDHSRIIRFIGCSQRLIQEYPLQSLLSYAPVESVLHIMSNEICALCGAKTVDVKCPNCQGQWCNTCDAQIARCPFCRRILSGRELEDELQTYESRRINDSIGTGNWLRDDMHYTDNQIRTYLRRESGLTYEEINEVMRNINA